MVGRATGPVGVGESCWGPWDVDPVTFLGLAQDAGSGLDWMEIPCPSKGFRHILPFL